MKTLKGWITTTFLATALTLSTTSVNAGVIIAGLTDKTDPCMEPTTKEKVNSGVIIAGFGSTGVIIAGIIGVIIAGATDEPDINCGVIIAG
jgi:hypothetical protein